MRIFTDDGTEGSGLEYDGVYACARANGKKVHLYADDDYLSFGTIERIAGRFVAYSWHDSPGCKAACPPGQGSGTGGHGVVNARIGRRLSLPEEVTPLVSSSGAAWLTCCQVLWAWDGRAKRRQVDAGDIDPRSLRLVRGVLSWTRDGRIRSTTLR